jgi:GNAT superfamily N-acetyltransferase
MEVQQARIEEVGELQALFAAAIAWQRQRGVPTFTTFPASFFAQEIDKGAIFLAWRGGQLVGTVSLYEADDFIWDNDAAPALYIHRLASLRTMEGRGVGGALIAWSRQRAVRLGKQWLRVDCWADNDELCRFYEGQGFTRVRIKNTGQHAGLPEHYQQINLQLFQMPVNG